MPGDVGLEARFTDRAVAVAMPGDVGLEARFTDRGGAGVVAVNAGDAARAVEAQRLAGLVGNDHRAAYELLERQLGVLVLRTQVMLSLSGIVITVTGFSGKAIAQSGVVARVCISAGIVIVLAAALAAVGGVLRLRWLSQQLGDHTAETLARGLALRDRKAAWLRAAMVLFGVGFSLYCVAIAQLLISA